jgi:hypothetical protein
MVTKIHFTTTSEYKVQRPDKRNKSIFKCYLQDPQFPVPKEVPAGLEEMPAVGDYVLVKAETIKDLQTAKGRYKYDPKDSVVLTKDWEAFDDLMDVNDLWSVGNFLLYYQEIDTTTSACKTKPTERDVSTPAAPGKKTPGKPPPRRGRR